MGAGGGNEKKYVRYYYCYYYSLRGDNGVINYLLYARVLLLLLVLLFPMTGARVPGISNRPTGRKVKPADRSLPPPPPTTASTAGTGRVRVEFVSVFTTAVVYTHRDTGTLHPCTHLAGIYFRNEQRM